LRQASPHRESQGNRGFHETARVALNLLLNFLREINMKEEFSRTSKEDLTQLILTYLKQNAEAGDTLEGIARWWVMRQNISHSVNQVQQALETLKNMGAIDECRVSNQETIYIAREQFE
jgi:hypothetical protein